MLVAQHMLILSAICSLQLLFHQTAMLVAQNMLILSAIRSLQLLFHQTAMLVAQASSTFSGVAGIWSWNLPDRCASLLAARTASLIAKKTETPLKNGGSPIPLDE